MVCLGEVCLRLRGFCGATRSTLVDLIRYRNRLVSFENPIHCYTPAETAL